MFCFENEVLCSQFVMAVQDQRELVVRVAVEIPGDDRDFVIDVEHLIVEGQRPKFGRCRRGCAGKNNF